MESKFSANTVHPSLVQYAYRARRISTPTRLAVSHIKTRAAERIFIWGGGGAKTKKGTVISKRALTVYMRIIITNALMNHHCRHKVSFDMLSVIFF